MADTRKDISKNREGARELKPSKSGDEAFFEGIKANRMRITPITPFAQEARENSVKSKGKIEAFSNRPTNLKEINEKLAEMIGIILGDGNLYEGKGKYRLRITTNNTGEIKHRKHIIDLSKQIFDIIPRRYKRKNKNAVDLVFHSKELISLLKEKGLKVGDKVKNQVGAPKWIKENEILTKNCLRGLFDTDGSIFLRNSQKSFGINFKNSSFRLVRDFQEMCEFLDIKTQKIPKPKISFDLKTKKKYEVYQVTIENKYEIAKFLDIVKPRKWEYNARIIGMALLTFKDPSKRQLIKKRLDKKYPNKKVHYTEEYADFLKDLCEKYGLKANKNTIIDAIKTALENKTKKFNRLNENGIQLIKDLEKIIRK